MAQPLSMDLRSRLLAEVDGGLSCRAAAIRFGVAPSKAIRWQAQRRETGEFDPKPQGGDTRIGFEGMRTATERYSGKDVNQMKTASSNISINKRIFIIT